MAQLDELIAALEPPVRPSSPFMSPSLAAKPQPKQPTIEDLIGFLTNAKNMAGASLGGTSELIGGSIGGAADAVKDVPVLGGAVNTGLEGLGLAATSPFGIPALQTESGRRGFSEGYKTKEGDFPGIFDIPAVLRGVSQAGRTRGNEAAQNADNTNNSLGDRIKEGAYGAFYNIGPNIAPGLPALRVAGAAGKVGSAAIRGVKDVAENPAALRRALVSETGAGQLDLGATGRAKWEPVNVAPEGKPPQYRLRNNETGAIDPNHISTTEKAAFDAANRRNTGPIRPATTVAPKAPVPETPGFLKTAEQKIAGPAETLTPELASQFARLTDNQVITLSREARTPAEQALIGAEMKRRGEALFVPPGQVDVTSVLQQIPAPLQTAVRRQLRVEPGLTATKVIEKFGPVIDHAVQTMKYPVTAENRLLIAGGLIAKEKAANVRNAGVNAARRAKQVEGIQQEIGGSTVGDLAKEMNPPKPPAPPPPPGIGSELWNLQRALSATADVSQLLRQGLVTLVSNGLSTSPRRRLIAAEAFRNAFKGYSRKYADQVWNETKADPLFETWKKQGGFESALDAVSTGPKEEFFQSRLAENIPGVGKVVKGAESSYALTLNSLRFQTWKETVLNRIKNGRPMSEGEQAALARFLNISTGRGSFKALENNIGILNALFFSPRFAVSRVQVFTEPFRAWKAGYKELAVREAADLAKTVTAGMGFLALMNAAGFKTGTDPTSSDFGKVQVGNTSHDIWGGFQQPAVLAARIISDQTTSAGGKSSSLTRGGFGKDDPVDLGFRFAESKAHPTVGTIFALVRGEDFTGQPFGPRGGHDAVQTAGDIAQKLLPISPTDVAQAVHDDLTKSRVSESRGLPPGTLGAISGVSSMFGVGANTYDRGNPDVAAEQFQLNQTVEDKPGFGGLSATRQLEFQEKAKIATDARLASLIQNPAYQNADPKKRAEMFEANKNAATNQVKRDYALQIVMGGSPDEVLPAVNAAITASGNALQKGQTLTDIDRMGKLTPSLVSKLDAQRKDGEPTVRQLIDATALADVWLKTPEFNEGTKVQWDAAAKAAAQLRRLRADAEKRGKNPSEDPQIEAFYETQAGGWLANLYSKSGSKNPKYVSEQRIEIQKNPLWQIVGRSAALKEHPEAP